MCRSCSNRKRRSLDREWSFPRKRINLLSSLVPFHSSLFILHLIGAGAGDGAPPPTAVVENVSFFHQPFWPADPSSHPGGWRRRNLETAMRPDLPQRLHRRDLARSVGSDPMVVSTETHLETAREHAMKIGTYVLQSGTRWIPHEYVKSVKESRSISHHFTAPPRISRCFKLCLQTDKDIYPSGLLVPYFKRLEPLPPLLMVVTDFFNH